MLRFLSFNAEFQVNITSFEKRDSFCAHGNSIIFPSNWAGLLSSLHPVRIFRLRSIRHVTGSRRSIRILGGKKKYLTAHIRWHFGVEALSI